MKLQDIDYARSTALVTGASSGIGRAIAFELAARGIRKMVVVARGEEKLAKAASELRQSAPGIDVREISIDLSKHDAPAEIQRQVEAWGWQVDLLVNDAGIARKQLFAKDMETDISLLTVDLMIRAVIDLSLRFLPPMVERGHGGILNVCSTAAYNPVPFTAMYAASKAFMLSWSQAVREENRDTGVRVACIVPGVTETNLDGDGHGERRGLLDAVGIDQPEDVAKAAVDALEENAAQSIVGTNNKLLKVAQGLLPDSLNARLISKARGAPEESDNVGPNQG
ncbi:SDR family NAD(P)-dependent oxidoreductase [Methylobacterium brachiatum]|jgi:short-subunit dehydrogenase|uniref:SDR family NAD(P)-dependent oxidoreductase n=1 Tax=Methylobacterium brachiatum TaxID=269660 RepID=A0AAJ1WXW5_9HYPH|nr:SDR family NAD(P)-dependent oxidoreductase [Methylobacterium brachiatum]MCB4804221.1 SDR family NAD(P)-dependent oxidoreductase [Methylobacterium brachiatum]MDH2310858.1 SDR family NAD(P)-dependent oxidoreductase [Methylobacterium brachiatum]MDQ0545230.1 short-subunit dehydrogenase [Methylobacterium brachiatum]